jgi:hypothetical protein
MSRSKSYGLIAAVCVGVFLLLVLSTGTSNPESDISIDFAGNSNSLRGPIAMLRLSNQGKTTVKLDAYCTLYWTNHHGLETNMFFKHDQGYAILRPGQSNLVAVSHPADAKVWETSFSYTVRPNAMKRVLNRIRFMLPGNWVPDNSFSGRFGPLITNPTFATEKAISAKD